MEKLKTLIFSKKSQKFYQYLQFLIVLAILPLLFIKISLLLNLIGIIAIIYFIVDIAETFKENDALSAIYLKIYGIIASLILVASIAAGIKNGVNTLIAVGIVGVAFYIFRIYYVISKGLFNKNINLVPGTIILISSLVVGIFTYLFAPIDIFALVVFSLGAIYVTMYWLVKLILDRGDSNRQI